MHASSTPRRLARRPQGFLRRCGANWGAFLLLQVIALWRWQRDATWLAVIAGVRLSDIFTDWTYLATSETVTTMGAVSLVAPGFINWGLPLALVWAYRNRATN